MLRVVLQSFIMLRAVMLNVIRLSYKLSIPNIRKVMNVRNIFNRKKCKLFFPAILSFVKQNLVKIKIL
jgi:hypothetical protein